ncbi:MAG TPA: DNA repair protein RecN [Dissulfurispiraceae bacterium]|nr:DNA repair protein RecN [Dissulfurispiraceae bacterium]
MLRELRIKDFTIIDDLTVVFLPGLNVLTGETGAGKSIIVDALGVLLGEKASQDLIRTGAPESRIEASFDAADLMVLKDLDIDSSDGIILRRILGRGKGRSYINDTPVSIQAIAAVGSELVDIHGQHEHQSLLKKESHLSFVDTFGGLAEDAAALQAFYKDIVDIRDRVHQIKEKARERQQRSEFLKFQIGEIEAASLKENEKSRLEEEKTILANASRLKESAEAVYDLLYGAEGSVIERISRAEDLLKEMSRIDNRTEESAAIVKSALSLIEDASHSVRKIKETYDIDPARLTEVDDRIETIRKLERKYGDGTEGILSYLAGAHEELRGLDQSEEERDAAEHDLAEKESRLSSMAEQLSGKRAVAAKQMARLIIQELRELGFQKADFRIDLKRKASIGASGIDDAEFLFSANPGELPRPLVKVASGGELSRIMLGLKCLEIGRHDSLKKPKSSKVTVQALKTLIFDEVDAGIGGATAQHVGNRLHALSANYQILCITHLPQIAARAVNHILVDKQLSDKEVKVTIDVLSDEARREELARMLSGRVTDRSLKHAEEMLEIDNEGERKAES